MRYILLLVLLSMVLVGCGGEAAAKSQDTLPKPESVGNPAEGELIFNAWHADAPACSTCHLVEGNQTLVGPSLANIATRAGNQVNGVDTVDYIRQSIIDPDAYVVDGGATSIMYQHFGERLTTEQIDNLVAYLLTLR